MHKLLLATTNLGKAREYRHLLKGLPYQLVTLNDENITTVIEEKDFSFEENARLKAIGYAEASNCITLADDSGLEVDALNGAPGTRSARFAEDSAVDLDNIMYLLNKMDSIPWEQRTAHFTCVIAIAFPGPVIRSCRGECQGIITLEPKGENGFGYDPVFFLSEFNKTMAELPFEVKNSISHRAAAINMARTILEQYTEETGS